MAYTMTELRLKCEDVVACRMVQGGVRSTKPKEKADAPSMHAMLGREQPSAEVLEACMSEVRRADVVASNPDPTTDEIRRCEHRCPRWSGGMAK